MNAKRIGRGLIALLAVLLAIAPLAANAEHLHVLGCSEWVSLREAPSTSAKRVVKIPLRATVYVTGEAQNGFRRAMYGGYDGYILEKYLYAAEPGALESGFATPMYVANCREYINLRAEKSTSAESRAQLPLGTRVNCLTNPEYTTDMALIQWTNPATGERIDGYALRKYLSLLPAGDCLTSATMCVGMPEGDLNRETITDPAQLRALEQILRGAQSATRSKCSPEMQLILTLADGTQQYLSCPAHGCPVFWTENGEEYDISSDEEETVRQIFNETFAKMEKLGY